MKSTTITVTHQELSPVLKIVWQDVVLSGLVIIGFMGVAYVKSVWPQSLPWLLPDYRTHVGAEYDCIARAVRAGHGFSDPFHEQTGPTAWMPPVLPYLMAGIYWLASDNTKSMTAFMVLLQAAGTWLAGLIVLSEARRLGKIYIGIAIILGVYTANFYQLFQQTHDTGWLLIVVSLTWLLAIRSGEQSAVPSWSQAITWGAWGGLATLSSPVLGMVWVGLTCFGATQFLSVRCCLCKHLTLPFRAMREILGRSSDSQGSVNLARCETMRVAKPGLTTLDTSQATSFTGERLFRKNFWPRLVFPLLIWALTIAPWTIRNRVQLGRWIPIKSNGMYELWQSQCLDNDGILDYEVMSRHPWSSIGEQRQQYRQAGEIAFIEEKGALAKQAILARPLDFLNRMANRAIAAFVYYTSGQLIEEYFADGWPILWARVVHPWPLIAIGCIMIFGAMVKTHHVAITLVIFALGLGPYVLISYYDRYAAMLVGIKCLLVLYGCDAVFCKRETG
ncbi:MAG: hypothetical protein KDB03_15030 [Planctomycetales bacterium]|nr:hypothetical protein [Planctomycetales bacterium]